MTIGIDNTQIMSANLQIDVESLHIGPKIDCSTAQNVNTKTKIQIFLCKMSSKVNLKLTSWI